MTASRSTSPPRDTERRRYRRCQL